MYISRWPIYLSFLSTIPASVLGIPIHTPVGYYNHRLEADVQSQMSQTVIQFESDGTVSETGYAISEVVKQLVTIADTHHEVLGQFSVMNYPAVHVHDQVHDYKYGVTGGPVCGGRGCRGEVHLGDGGKNFAELRIKENDRRISMEAGELELWMNCFRFGFRNGAWHQSQNSYDHN
ncbi:hypothetical protein FB446DRAFT_479704 [Lentinula raphanica]|nr:hypothetical protein C8R42DRAFT_169555 [Lentinula raphanica]KAJ3774425.1 hypothetical protein FB446DRAFT_479704 [Lentinula raphanica]